MHGESAAKNARNGSSLAAMLRGHGSTGRALLLGALTAVAGIESATARPANPILHERISADPREDLALHVSLEGDLPAAIDTPSGVVAAPDPERFPRSSDTVYGPGTERATFVPDRETGRPNVGAYDEPFTPATAPFKRLEAFDAVRSDYRLYVRDERLVEVARIDSPGTDEEAFFADIIVDVASDRTVRIPSVGPGARIVRAHLSFEAIDLPVHVMRDAADNWFLQFYRTPDVGRGRLVMQVAIARAASGGQPADAAWSDLPFVAALPSNVAREAAVVRSAIGVDHGMRPRQAIEKLVGYFRAFSDSDEPLRGHGSVYLDLALSKKGVCRHRAFAFLVTAQSLGIPARMIVNEVHAWVEVHDGTLWRRLDLGGAGRMAVATPESTGDRAVYEPPPDPFAWPPSARPGSDMALHSGPAGGAPGAARLATHTTPASSAGLSSPTAANAFPPTPTLDGSWSSDAATAEEGRARPSVYVLVTTSNPHRGQPLDVHGEVRAGGVRCPHVGVEVWLRPSRATKVGDPQKNVLLGTLATDDNGKFVGALLVPVEAPVGDYDVIAAVPGMPAGP